MKLTLPPLPNPVCYYWTPKQESGISADLSSWSTNTGPHPDWDVGRYFNEDELRARDLEVARVVLEGAAVTAWTHYMDTCKKRGIAPADCEHWLAASPIRALEVSHE